MSNFASTNDIEGNDELKLEYFSDGETNGDEMKVIKQEDLENGNTASGNGEKTKTNGKATTTPRKRGRKTATDKANGDGDGEGEDESPTKKQRTPAKGSKGAASGEKAKVGARAMPTSYENASPEDRMLLRMKDEENKSWGEIRQAWEEMTGEKVGGSTLCGRYGRIKANFVVFTPEDEERLLRFKREIEEKFENDKWRSVSDAIGAAGGKKYPPAAVQKRFKELNKNMSRMEIGLKEENHAEDSA
ncbi:conserved hypothetical protein [Histoplasma capsulatum G186AR]|uniref:Myb-like domain-containing protein n=2 Tax=Ajellomyces capsulatus TaxID=5037 RepID=C0NDG6_AJECG|nr:uncharacterized protein HCBG_01162 [Histoplasma capsulatum G186AR]EEH11707.1 conserved hypothetical protein [Histoplasma capsulatum G186AR]KAG5302441.1 hypothetical protein I7I52_00088 [Histoplasma capsulatum]QSS72160.1 hypothetical protein I7I50_03243 [Histoplasma capsulatum G186AR]